MNAIPQEWIDAGVEGIDVIAGEAPEELLAEIAEAVLTAALPLIREAIAERLEQMADDIEWDEVEAVTMSDAHPVIAIRDFAQEQLHEAARIARGGAL